MKQFEANVSIIMNVWEYFEQEAKKNGLLAKCVQKILKAIGKGFQQ